MIFFWNGSESLQPILTLLAVNGRHLYVLFKRLWVLWIKSEVKEEKAQSKA